MIVRNEMGSMSHQFQNSKKPATSLAQARSHGTSTFLQRKCACGGSGTSEGRCEECRQKEANMQRRGTGAGPAKAPQIVHEVLRSPGQPLAPQARAFFEPRLGHDFSTVRVHSDEKAAESARAVNALAYAVGYHVVFAPGRYSPQSEAGLQLLAHELVHVAQQVSRTPPATGDITIDPSTDAEREACSLADGSIRDRSRPPRSHPKPAAICLQRQTDVCSGAGAKCAEGKACDLPDPGTEHEGASQSWILTVNIDISASDFEAALRASPPRLGHTYVAFSESNGKRFTYGFYPAHELPDENKRTVDGCVHHPDTTHAQCIDDTVMYSLSNKQYDDALAAAKKLCREGHTYGVDFTCTTFAEEIARGAGQSLPSSKSQPMTIFYQPVPPIDNPNTLFENVQEERKKDKYKQFPYWNNPCYNQCEAEFNDCLKRGSGSFGLFGGPMNALQPQQCMASRNLCYQKCPKP
jgi:hypothetical protein